MTDFLDTDRFMTEAAEPFVPRDEQDAFLDEDEED